MTGPIYSSCGKQILRDGAHFADAATTDIAAALVLVLNGQVLFGPYVPAAQQEQAEKVLWGQ